MPAGFGVRGWTGHHTAGDVTEQCGGENAVVAGVAAVEQRDQNRHISDEPDTPPPQVAAKGAGRHQCADRQHQRAQGKPHAGDELGILEQPTGRRAQAKADNRACSSAGERSSNGAGATQPWLGDGEHDEPQHGINDELDHAARQEQRAHQFAEIELGHTGV